MNSKLKTFEESEFQTGESSNTPKESDNPKDFLNIIERTISQKYVLRIKLVINQEFTLETLALVDTGADRNINREGLIPNRYYEKTTQTLQCLNIKYKLSNAIVCIEEIYIYMTFIFVQNAGTIVILGNPFTALIEPFTIDDGVSTQSLKVKR